MHLYFNVQCRLAFSLLSGLLSAANAVCFQMPTTNAVCFQMPTTNVVCFQMPTTNVVCFQMPMQGCFKRPMLACFQQPMLACFQRLMPTCFQLAFWLAFSSQCCLLSDANNQCWLLSVANDWDVSCQFKETIGALSRCRRQPWVCWFVV